MAEQEAMPVDVVKIREMLKQKKQMKSFLAVCASCGFCADSCLIYRNNNDRRNMPSYKAINSLGKLFKKKGRVDRTELEEMKELIWGRCVLCRRCYCPFGIDISGMISWARSICRSQSVYERYDLDVRGVRTGYSPSKEKKL